MPEREFVFVDNRFYSVVDEHAPHTVVADGGAVFATPAVGVWAMRELTTQIPAGARPVRLLDPADVGGGGVSDTGETWQARAIRAEMEAAQLRTEVAAAIRRANLAESGERAQMVAMRGARESDRVAWDTMRASLLALAERVAVLYGREAELSRAAVRCDGEHDNHPGGADHAYDPQLCAPRGATAEELIAFIEATLALDHPAVRFPQPGPATIANACQLARYELARRGGTLDTVAEAILRMAAEPQRPAELSNRPTSG